MEKEIAFKSAGNLQDSSRFLRSNTKTGETSSTGMLSCLSTFLEQ